MGHIDVWSINGGPPGGRLTWQENCWELNHPMVLDFPGVQLTLGCTSLWLCPWVSGGTRWEMVLAFPLTLSISMRCNCTITDSHSVVRCLLYPCLHTYQLNIGQSPLKRTWSTAMIKSSDELVLRILVLPSASLSLLCFVHVLMPTIDQQNGTKWTTRATVSWNIPLSEFNGQQLW